MSAKVRREFSGAKHRAWKRRSTHVRNSRWRTHPQKFPRRRRSACALFLTKLSEMSIKRLPVRAFFAYPQALWISLWMIDCFCRPEAHRCAPQVALANL
jgi:hypothetical protein